MIAHTCLYDFLRDQGGFIAGLLTLVAGGLAYFAGRVQATETRKAAAAQVIAILEQKNQAHDDAVAQIQALERQLEERNREIADQQWRAKVEIVRALAAEAGRLRRYASDRLEVAKSKYSAFPDYLIEREYLVSAPYQIKANDVLNRVGVIEFQGTGIMEAATRLNAMIDVLSSAVEFAGMAGELKWGALIGHLENVILTAETLNERLETWEMKNPVVQ